MSKIILLSLAFRMLGYVGIMMLSMRRHEEHPLIRTLTVCFGVALITSYTYDFTSGRFWAETLFTAGGMFIFFRLIDKLFEIKK